MKDGTALNSRTSGADRGRQPDSGEALGLHFSGSFLVTNYAVRADVALLAFDPFYFGESRLETRDYLFALLASALMTGMAKNR